MVMVAPDRGRRTGRTSGGSGSVDPLTSNRRPVPTTLAEDR